MGETHAQETAQRHSLKFELERLAELNARMTEEAAALTRALKGDSKQQGNWGEVVLALQNLGPVRSDLRLGTLWELVGRLDGRSWLVVRVPVVMAGC